MGGFRLWILQRQLQSFLLSALPQTTPLLFVPNPQTAPLQFKPTRCNVPDLLAGLESISTTLLDQSFALEALPVICLWEHAARHAARQLQPTVLARAARARALCALGRLGEVAGVIWGLMAAHDLPEDPSSLWTKVVLVPRDLAAAAGAQQGAAAAKAAAHKSHAHGQQAPPHLDTSLLAQLPVYDAAAWPGAPQNKPCCELISADQLHPEVSASYGPWLAAVVDRARAGWLLAAGGVCNHWRRSDPATGAKAAPAAAPAAGGKGGAAAQHASAQQVADAAASGPHTCEAVEESLLDAAAAILRADAAAAIEALHTCSSAPAAAAAADGSSNGSPGGGSVPGSRPSSARSPTSARSGGREELPPIAAAAGGGARPHSARSDGKQALVLDPGGCDVAQHCHTAVHSLLMLSESEARRWLPGRGLEAAVQAARLARENAGRASAALAVGGDASRYGLNPGLWLRIRLQVGWFYILIAVA